MSKKKIICLGALGGTIASAQDPAGSGGVAPVLGPEELAAAVPGLRETATIKARAFRQVAGGAVKFVDLLAFLAWAEQEAAAGAAGFVLTQGTDTIEETSFFLDLFWRRDEPIVVTGAMRSADQVSADGPANLLAATRVAAAPASRGRGAQVVLNDAIHEARWVRKVNSLALEAFQSSTAGPAGAVVEGNVHYFRSPASRHPIEPPKNTAVRVPLIEICLSDDLLFLDCVAASGCAGLVLSAFGAGHAPLDWAEPIGTLARAIPVVVATRAGMGPTASHTYSFKGSELDLARRGAILAGWLDPRKSRILLWALAASGASIENCRDHFRMWNASATS